jgi:hypothetical protein
MAESISYNDMVYGQGEWKNLQEVIRKTFKACFSDLKQHDEELSSLTEQIHTLKEELNNRPTWEDLDKMIQLKLPSNVRNGAGVYAESDLQQQILQLRTEMEKKVSLSYFEMTLGKKMDRSDVLVRELSRFSLKEYQDDIKRLKMDQIHYQSQIDEIQEMVRKQQVQTNVCSTKFDDIALLQALLESLQKSVYERPTTHFVETTMKQMVAKLYYFLPKIMLIISNIIRRSIKQILKYCYRRQRPKQKQKWYATSLFVIKIISFQFCCCRPLKKLRKP